MQPLIYHLAQVQNFKYAIQHKSIPSPFEVYWAGASKNSVKVCSLAGFHQ